MPEAPIIEVKTIKELLQLKKISYNTTLLLDLDNTVMESQIELGSDQWFVRLCVNAVNELPPEKKPVELVIALYHEVQKLVRTQAVEPLMVKLIRFAQDIGLTVIAITARDVCLKDATVRQLRDIGVNFSSKAIPDVMLVNVSPGRHAYLEDGIIYCGGQDKGLCFSALEKATFMRFQHVALIDDKDKHLQHVKEVVSSLGVDFHGFRYGYLDDKVNALNIDMAHMQLMAVLHRLPEHAREHVKTLKIPRKRHAEEGCVDRFFYPHAKHAVDDIALTETAVVGMQNR